MAREVNQIMPALVYGDAIGNHAYEIWKLLRGWGIKSSILANYVDPRYADAGRDYRSYKGNAGNILIYHYSIGSPITAFALDLPDRVALYYHNITPAHFFHNINPRLEQELAIGRAQLESLTRLNDVIAASEFNRIELQAAGFRDAVVIPYLVDFSRLDRGAKGSQANHLLKQYGDGRLTLLFVGRIAPNKCQHDLIHLVNYYRSCIDPDVRLLLVGRTSNAAAYQLKIEMLARRLGLGHNVCFTGQVGTDDGLGALYQLSHAFVSMSEHEGFCVPVIESMHFGLPVVAYRSSGVPYTLGNAGVMFSRKHYDQVAEVINLLRINENFHAAIVAGQHERLHVFDKAVTTARLRDLLVSWQAPL